VLDDACTITLVGVPLSLLLNVLLGVAWTRGRDQRERLRTLLESERQTGGRGRGARSSP
jgi:hypothetical protein